MEFLAMMEKAGFSDVQMVGHTPFKSTPKTVGALFRAVKAAALQEKLSEKTMSDPISIYQEFFDMVYADGAIDRRTKHLIALAASLTAGCEP